MEFEKLAKTDPEDRDSRTDPVESVPFQEPCRRCREGLDVRFEEERAATPMR